jgi:hypothetical protein
MNAGHHRRKETPRTFGETGTMVSYNMYFIIILYITNVMNHQIQVGDVKPIRKQPYRVQYALRQETYIFFYRHECSLLSRTECRTWHCEALKKLNCNIAYRVLITLRVATYMLRKVAVWIGIFQQTNINKIANCTGR